jgi:mRNA interferase MazF
MATFSQGDVVKVPFPYTDKSTRQSRPALVVSMPDLQQGHNLIWVVMITSAENRGWPSDVTISAPSRAGLPVPSVIRTAKIATFDASDATKLGTISEAQLKQVMDRIGRALELSR